MGLDKQGNQKGTWTPGMDIYAKQTIFAEGSRGHLGKQLIREFNLDENKTIEFIGSGDVVVTNSYHGAYWATLLGKVVVAFPWASKFYGLKDYLINNVDYIKKSIIGVN